MPDPKAAPAPSNDPLDVVANFYKNFIGSPFALLVFILFLIAIFVLYQLSLTDEPMVVVQTYVQHYLGPYLPTINIVFTIISMVWVVGIVYVLIRTREINSIEYRKYRSIDVEQEEVYEHDTQWEVVQNHLRSEISAEWRIAVMEADTMLDDALKRAGGKGDSLGERLKSLSPASFQNLQAAWDAHKVRNMIAHEGVNFQLTQREAKRVIDLYEKALKELKYI
jgi:hypothetical protein